MSEAGSEAGRQAVRQAPPPELSTVRLKCSVIHQPAAQCDFQTWQHMSRGGSICHGVAAHVTGWQHMSAVYPGHPGRPLSNCHPSQPLLLLQVRLPVSAAAAAATAAGAGAGCVTGAGGRAGATGTWAGLAADGLGNVGSGGGGKLSPSLCSTSSSARSTVQCEQQ